MSACKRYVLQKSSGLQACNFKHGCFPVNIPKVLGTTFFIEQFRWLLLNYILLSERFFKKESYWRDCL